MTSRRGASKPQSQRQRRPDRVDAPVTGPVSAAVAVGTEMAAGALETSGEIAAAAVDMVQTAAESLVSVATGGVRDLSSNDAAGSDDDDREKSESKGKGRRD